MKRRIGLARPATVLALVACAAEEGPELELRELDVLPAVDVVEAAEEALAQVFRARIRGMAFTPARIEITAGTTVSWRNEDDVAHTVTATDGSWDSGTLAPGATWQRRFDAPGTYPFTCLPHPEMRGTVVVRPRG